MRAPHHLRGLLLAAAGLLAALAVAPRAHAAATVVIDNFDSPGEGLNDLTPAGPVGGNGATTLGGQRLAVLETAAAVWSGILDSPTVIHVAAVFDPLSCSATGATLGATSANCLHFNFDGAPFKRTWFAASLANLLSGGDLCPSASCLSCFAADMTAQFNSTIGTTCSFPRTWYYGLDGNPPPGTVDFLTVVLHEFAHGLGFFSAVSPNGLKLFEMDDAYMRRLEDHTSGLLYPQMTDAQRGAANVDTGNLHWVGPSTVAASGILTDGVEPVSGHVELYAPATYSNGSSVSHFSTDATPNQLMEPFYTGPLHDVGLTRNILQDIGWQLTCGNGVLDPGETCDDGNARDGDCCSSACVLEPAGTPCASADLCTVGGSCNGGGTCLGGAPDDCDDGNPCTDDACRPGTGCAHFPNSAPCDDGIACTSDDRCEMRRCTGDWSCSLDHFRLYKARRRSGSARTPAQTVQLLDSFDSRRVVTSTTAFLGSPAALAPGAPDVPSVHLECYKAKDRKVPSTPFAGLRVTFTNEFGTASVDVRKTQALCVTASTAAGGPPADLIAHRVDHYRCYGAKTSPGTTPPSPQTITLADEFGTRQQITTSPVLFCNPVLLQQNGYLASVINAPDARLACYKASDTQDQPPFPRQNVFTRNRFGTGALSIRASGVVCVPSTLVTVGPLP